MKKQIKMKNKFLLFFVLVFVGVFLVSNVSADSWDEEEPEITDLTIYVNSNAVWQGHCGRVDNCSDENDCLYDCYTKQIATPALERGEQISIKTVFKTNTDLDNIRVRAWINGYREEIEAKTSVFDVFKDNQYSKVLFLSIPSDIDAKDEYTIYVKIETKTELSGVDEAEITADVQRIANLLKILSVELYDYGTDKNTKAFESGSAFYAEVVVKNTGNHNTEDVFVKLSIPELELERTVYVGDLGPFDNGYEDTVKKTITMVLPEHKEGVFDLIVKAYNSELGDKETLEITVVKELERNVEIMPQKTEAEIKQGETATYSFVVANFGETQESFIIEVLGISDWATVQINPASFALASGETRTVQIKLMVDEDALIMDHPATIRVRFGNEAEQFNINTRVTSKAADWQIVLMIIGLIVAIIAIVLLAIMLKRDKTSKKQETVESYY